MHSEALGPGRRGKDALSYCGPNGGGYGDPRQRDPERVLRAVRRNWVSEQAARTVYGVAVRWRPDLLDWEIDATATAELRGETRETA